MNDIVCYVSFENDFPEWSDIILTPSVSVAISGDIDNYINKIINCIEWSTNKRVKALKLELNNVDTSHFKENKEITFIRK